MKRKHKILIILLAVSVTISLTTVPAFALTESEVQDQVNAVGKESVTGNLFVWFLCAIAFLKVSQKIDSFMSSLGINVGHTGGSMLAEAMIAMRVQSKAKQLGTWWISNYTPEYRETSGVGKRKLLTMDEVLRLPISKALIIIRGRKLLQVDKCDYTKHPESKKMISCKASAHIPEWQKKQPKEVEEVYYTACAGEAIAKAGYAGTVDYVASSLARLIRNSPDHWSYIGSGEYRYIGVGITYERGMWYCDVALTKDNYG